MYAVLNLLVNLSDYEEKRKQILSTLNTYIVEKKFEKTLDENKEYSITWYEY